MDASLPFPPKLATPQRRGTSFDLWKETRQERRAFRKVRNAEREYAAKLRQVSRIISDIIRGFTQGESFNPERLAATLNQYTSVLEPWARSVAERMLADVNRRDDRAWRQHANLMGIELKRELQGPTGFQVRAMLEEQVDLITSLPRDAAMRVHDITFGNLYENLRGRALVDEILRTGEVTRSRAELIARTEIARTAATMTMVRARSIGSTHYTWRAALDNRTRPSHKRMSGRVCAWDDPPVVEPDKPPYHAGMIYNCFPGSTKVSLTNGCHYLFRRWYEGRLIRVQHEAGFLDLTPNHPILTQRGWVAADDLKATDYIVQSLQDSRFALYDDENEGQPTFDDLFATLNGISRSEAHSGLLFNFHGEVVKNDIDTIRADHLLPGHAITPGLQSIGNFPLSRTHSMIADSRVMSCDAHFAETHISGGCNKVPSSFGRHALYSAHIGLGSCAALNTMPVQDFGDSSSIATKSQGNSQLALPIGVGLDNIAFRKVMASSVRRCHLFGDYDTSDAQMLAKHVRMTPDLFSGVDKQGASRYKFLRLVNKSVRNFANHVYTIQSANGWYSVASAGIIVKNCRCYPEPIINLDDI